MLAPQVRQREVDQSIAERAVNEGFSPFQAQIIGARLPQSMVDRAGSVARAIAPTLAQLDHPGTLPDIDLAVTRIVRAIDTGETLAGCCDHDADGISASSVLKLGFVALLGVAPERMVIFTTDKLAEGYGLSDAFVDRVLADGRKPTLLITADQGSCDEPRIARLREVGIDTIVTDHHGLPAEGTPKSAIACVNPIRTDGRFPDPAIAGCHVAWLVVCAVRRHLLDRGDTLPDVSPVTLLDFVGLGTCCDCVSLANSINNRALIRAALRQMNGPSPRPCWPALAEAAGRDPGAPIDESTLGYTSGPRFNASGRIASAMPGVRLMLSEDPDEAREIAVELEVNNTERRKIQAGMVEDALALVQAPLEQNHPVLVLWLPDGHIGVQGIVAAHMVRHTGRAAICLASPPGNAAILSGSMRSLPGVHAKQLLDAVARAKPGILQRYGGHAGAAGVSFCASDFDAFRAAVHAAFIAMGAPAATGPIHAIDPAPEALDSMHVIEEIEALGPYGMDFPVPLFEGEFTVRGAKRMGDGTHLRLLIGNGTQFHRAVWFGAGDRLDTLPNRGRVLYRLTRNTWRGKSRADIHIEDILEVK